MRVILPLTLFGVAVFASPSLPFGDGLEARVSSELVADCEEAVNCEVYTDDEGYQATRFIPGMEPNTTAFRDLMVEIGLGSDLDDEDDYDTSDDDEYLAFDGPELEDFDDADFDLDNNAASDASNEQRDVLQELEGRAKKHKKCKKRLHGQKPDVKTHIGAGPRRLQLGCHKGHEGFHKNVMKKFNKLCPTGGNCFSDNPVKAPIRIYVSKDYGGTGTEDAKLRIVATGGFLKKHRKYFLRAVKALVRGTVRSHSKDWKYKKCADLSCITYSGTCNLWNGSDEYHVFRFVRAGGKLVQQGEVIVKLKDVLKIDEGFCKNNWAFIGAAAIAELIPEIGPAIAAFFGLIIAACSK